VIRQIAISFGVLVVHRAGKREMTPVMVGGDL
jgi:hypothetical protein